MSKTGTGPGSEDGLWRRLSLWQVPGLRAWCAVWPGQRLKLISRQRSYAVPGQAGAATAPPSWWGARGGDCGDRSGWPSRPSARFCEPSFPLGRAARARGCSLTGTVRLPALAGRCVSSGRGRRAVPAIWCWRGRAHECGTKKAGTVQAPAFSSAPSCRCGAVARPGQTSRLFSLAARTKSANSGCGWNGLDFSSGWNCTPTNQG